MSNKNLLQKLCIINWLEHKQSVEFDDRLNIPTHLSSVLESYKLFYKKYNYWFSIKFFKMIATTELFESIYEMEYFCKKAIHLDDIYFISNVICNNYDLCYEFFSGINAESFFRHYPKLNCYNDFELCLAAVRLFPWSICYMNNTEELSLNALKSCNIYDLERLFLVITPYTDNICKFALETDGYFLQHFKLSDNNNYSQLEFKLDKYIEFCYVALKNNPFAFKYIDEQIPTDKLEELSRFAVNLNGRSIEYMTHKSDETCNLAIKNDPHSVQFFYPTLEQSLLALNIDGNCIQHLEQPFIPNEYFLYAVQQTGRAIKFIEFQYRTRDIWLTAIEDNIENLDYYNPYVLTDYLIITNILKGIMNEIEFLQDKFGSEFDFKENKLYKTCIKILSIDGCALRYVTYQLDEMCITALNQNPDAIQYVWNQTKELWKLALKSDSSTLIFLEKNYKHYWELCYFVVEIDPMTIFLIDNYFNYPDIVLLAIKRDLKILERIKQTNEICIEVVKYNGLALKYIEKKTEELSLYAVNQNGLALEYIDHQTERICDDAVRNNVFAFKFVQKKYKDRIRKNIDGVVV